MKTKFTTDTKLESEIAHFENINLKLESGDIIDSFKLAFKTFGKLNTDKTKTVYDVLNGNSDIEETIKDTKINNVKAKNSPTDSALEEKPLQVFPAMLVKSLMPLLFCPNI